MKNNFHATSVPKRVLPLVLEDIEDAQLVRRGMEGNVEFIFKHALVQDSAYTSLTRNERKRLHHLVAGVLEEMNRNTLDENAALLAYHFERADESAQALAYLQRAAEWARRGAAYREQAALLRRAIDIAVGLEQTQMLGTLRAQRGQALLNVTEWREARTELERALEQTPPEDLPARAQVLLDLAAATQWLWDIVTSMRYAQEALDVAERTGNDALAASAMTSLAVGQMSDGHARESIETFERAFARTVEPDTLGLVRAMEYFGLGLFWLGVQRDSLARSRTAVEHAHAISDHVTIVRALSNLAAAHAARGEYGIALTHFAEARAHAERHAILPWLARALSMESGMHLDLYDFSGAEALMDEARILARRVQFSATVVGTGIDLIFSSVRRGEITRAERFVGEVAQGIHTIFGSHRWLWEIRFLEARAELALAREQYAEALQFAEEAVRRSRETGRRKYELLGLLTGAQARGQRERAAARDGMRDAFAIAQELGDPVLILRTALARLDLEKDDAVRAVARGARTRIADALPESALREGFLAVSAEWL